MSNKDQNLLNEINSMVDGYTCAECDVYVEYFQHIYNITKNMQDHKLMLGANFELDILKKVITNIQTDQSVCLDIDSIMLKQFKLICDKYIKVLEYAEIDIPVGKLYNDSVRHFYIAPTVYVRVKPLVTVNCELMAIKLVQFEALIVSECLKLIVEQAQHLETEDTCIG